MPRIPHALLADFVASIFEAVGVPAADASITARSLVDSNLRGHDSHGVIRVPQYVDFLEKGEYKIGVDLKIESESPAIVVCDAGWGLGQVQARRLLDHAIERARKFGLGAATAHSCGHIGRLGEYAEIAAEAGLILEATVNNGGAGQRVAPPGGTEPRLGTNPLCIGVPTDTDPIILDFGTSVVAEGKVRVYYLNGKKPVPEGWLLDSKGNPTTDSSVLYEPPLGSILPMGGAQAYKGFGLGLVLDMLAGGLSGGRSSNPSVNAFAKGNNVVFLAIDPAGFAGREALTRESTQLARFVADCPRAPGVDSILLPGDPERRTLAERTTAGIPLEPAHWERLTSPATRLKVAIPNLERIDPTTS